MSSEEIESDTPGDSESPSWEFDFPLTNGPRPPTSSTDHIQRHTKLAQLLGLSEDLPNLQHVFSTVASLCDPYTQPEENEHSILSLDCISDLVIAISFSNLKYNKVTPSSSPEAIQNPEIQSLKFDLSLAYFTILQAILGGLNADDELTLRYVNNDATNWHKNLHIWTPMNLFTPDTFNLKLSYRMACVLLLAIYKLFKPEASSNSTEYNLALNPYLHYFIKTWKCQTNVILLGLEIDRRLEALDQSDPDSEYVTPYIVNAALKGSSAIRYVCTWILNQNPSSLQLDEEDPDTGILADSPSPSQVDVMDSEYDIKCESLINFMHPLGRKKINGGALSVDMRLVVIALLITNSGFPMNARQIEHSPNSSSWERERREHQAKPIAELGDILLDLEYQDRFDEDIRYIFDYEYEEEEGGEPVGVIDEEAEDNDQWEDVVPKLTTESSSKNKNEITTAKNSDIPKIGDLNMRVDNIRRLTPEEVSQLLHSEETNDEKTPVNSTKKKAIPTSNDNNGTTTTPTINHNKKEISTAVRSKDEAELDFDEFGRDWRDIPRGENSELHPRFVKELEGFYALPEEDKQDPDNFFPRWHEFETCLGFLAMNGFEGSEGELEDFEVKVGQSVLNTIAKAVKEETEIEEVEPVSSTTITPDRIYKYLSSLASDSEVATTQDNNKLIIPIFGITKFELLLHNNRKLAGCILDEMLMCKGYRRVLIWFITHNINLCPALINYVYELLVGLRGSADNQKPYLFSRKGGKIILSDVEQSMLLHEFLSNTDLYLFATEEAVETFYGYKIVLSESIAKKYSSLMCLMIDQLINAGIINIDGKKKDGDANDIYDYAYNLQMFLFNLIAKLPEARELYFRIKNAKSGQLEEESKGSVEKPQAKIGLEEFQDATEGHFMKERYDKLISTIKDLDIDEITHYFVVHYEDWNLLQKYGERLQKHIKLLVAQNDGDETSTKVSMVGQSNLNEIQDDLRFFMENFNELCKIDYLAADLFANLESIIQGDPENNSEDGDHDDGEKISGKEGKEGDADLLDESEFNDQFLDGVGKFSEKTTKSTSESKKKKKNKKKKGKKK
ncbi:hypothetical protein CAAN1_05S04830 [[Candida] anglica]|uniref:Uncharacterized protein n=1 Tax=[Candida] anglica TaxID=148631 RepID=A0ABP0EFL2_9ASCO